MTSVIYFVIVRTTRKPTVDDPPKIAGRYTSCNITIPAVSTDPGQLRHKYLPQRSLRRDREGGNRAVLPRTHQNNAMGSGSPGNDFLCTRQ